MLSGFTIGGFRNYSGEPQWVAPLGRVNIFIGTNNSGKSNILRFIKRVVHPLLAGGGDRKKLSLTGVDIPQGGTVLPYYETLLKFDLSEGSPIRSRIRSWHPSWGDELKRHLGFQDEYLRIPIRFPHSNNNPEFPQEHVQPKGDHQLQIWRSIWENVQNATGGDFKQSWYPGVMNFLIGLVKQDIDPFYIKTFRQITSKLPDFHDEYTPHHGGDHIIDQLAEIASPTWDQQHKKAQFTRLKSFVAEIIEDDDVEIEIPNDRSTVTVRSGSAYLPLEALGSGIHEVFMLAASIVLRDNQTILLEEPEVHLHPGLQRKFMKFLMESTENQIFIATHSAAIIDTPGAHVFGVSKDGDRAVIEPLLTDVEKFNSCRELGYKASDLLQANSIIWVEGPSDRIYLLKWFGDNAGELQEGVHFSIMFYGGMLLSHLTVTDNSFQDFINLLPICRTPAILIDSDQGAANSPLRDTKVRVIREFAEIGGQSWITKGREIENYYPFEQREEAIKSRHRNVERLTGGRNRYAKPLAFKRIGDPSEHVADKVAVAKYLTSHFNADESLLELGSDLKQLIAYIRAANN